MSSTSPAVSAAAACCGTWSRPTDRPAQAALAIASALVAAAVVPGAVRWLASMSDFASVADLGRRRRFLTGAAFIAAFLSLGYIAFYLRGGPRAPEAAVYWAQGHALSHGALSWTASEPTASFRAEHLFFRVPDRLSGIFAPGYPLLLAAGFLVGAPMLVGPLLAAALVVATWQLAHEVSADGPRRPERLGPPAEAIARLAAGLSIVSAALRYGTAEVLPYGAGAVAVTVSFASALRGRRTGAVRLFGVAGLAAGFLVASHPVSALAVGVVIAVLATGAPGRQAPARAFMWSATAALPGLLFLLAANQSATGHALVSAAAAYPSVMRDRPVVLWQGVGPAVASVREHLVEIANLEPLALLALVPLFARRGRAPALAALIVGGEALMQLATHARSAVESPGPMLVVLPIEHVLMAIGVARLFPGAFPSAAVGTIGLALSGFAFHASHAHEALAARDLGRPRFEPDAVREASVTHGLLFFDDDVGYELAYDPGVRASHGIEAARLRGDDHDRLLFDSLGHPPAHRYVVGATSVSVPPWTPPHGALDAWRFEAESDWPPIDVTGGVVEAIDPGNACASDGRVLRLTPDERGEARMSIALPIPDGAASVSAEKHGWLVQPRVLLGGQGGTGTMTLVAELGQPPLAEWSWSDAAHPAACLELPARAVELIAGRATVWLTIRAKSGAVMVDRTTVRAR